MLSKFDVGILTIYTIFQLFNTMLQVPPEVALSNLKAWMPWNP